MFENMNEQQARDAILESVKEYCDLYHKKPDYMEGDRIPYASVICNDVQWLRNRYGGGDGYYFLERYQNSAHQKNFPWADTE